MFLFAPLLSVEASMGKPCGQDVSLLLEEIVLLLFAETSGFSIAASNNPLLGHFCPRRTGIRFLFGSLQNPTDTVTETHHRNDNIGSLNAQNDNCVHI